MKVRTTPLGFLPGDIDLYSHCMYIYSGKDETFIRSVVDYLSAGISAGELCVCAAAGSVREEIKERMAKLGAGSESGQLSIVDAVDVYMPAGSLDVANAVRFWRSKLDVARDRWNGLRVFGEASGLLSNRVARLKFVEYEALVNLDFAANVALCGYQSSASTRSFILQAKSVHPFIANSRSIRRNKTYVEPPKFLASFYRFRRVAKVYPAGSAGAVQEDFEEIGARTPLAMSEIVEMKAAVGGVFANVAAGIMGRSGSNPSHIHVTFAPESDKFLTILRCHSSRPAAPQSLAADSKEAGLHLACQVVDDVNVDYLNGDVVVTMLKRYSASRI